MNYGRFWDDNNSEQGTIRKRLGVGTYYLGVCNGSLGHKLLKIKKPPVFFLLKAYYKYFKFDYNLRVTPIVPYAIPYPDSTYTAH